MTAAEAGGTGRGAPARDGTGLAGHPLVAPPLRPLIVSEQSWCELTFLHWPVDPARVERFMPPGCVPDCVDGVSYVGLVPFAMRRAALATGPPIPYLGSFGEVNVRLYSLDGAGRHGVLFRSLDCSRLAVVAGARLAGVPYIWSRVRAGRRDAETIAYSVRRRGGPAETGMHLVVRELEPVEATPLEDFLTLRWGCHVRWRGGTLWIPNTHAPWPLRAAEVLELTDDLVQAAGIEPSGPMLRPLFSPGVQTRFGRPAFTRPAPGARRSARGRAG